MVATNSKKARKMLCFLVCGEQCISCHYYGWVTTGLGRVGLLHYMREPDTLVLFVIVYFGVSGQLG